MNTPTCKLMSNNHHREMSLICITNVQHFLTNKYVIDVCTGREMRKVFEKFIFIAWRDIFNILLSISEDPRQISNNAEC